jgi:hypothetical protein
MPIPRIKRVGVPQGSVLSHTLFNMYVNDTPQSIGVYLAFLLMIPVSMRQNAMRLYPKKTSTWTQLSDGWSKR